MFLPGESVTGGGIVSCHPERSRGIPARNLQVISTGSFDSVRFAQDDKQIVTITRYSA